MKKIPPFILLLFITTACYKETYIPITANFTAEFANGDQSAPVIIKVNNLTKGAETYLWEFEGGSPTTSAVKDPVQISYTKAGTYTIKLTVKNRDGEVDIHTSTIEVKASIDIQFATQIIASNYPPVEVQINNATIGIGLTYNWTFEDGTPTTFSGKTPPNVVFSKPGTHKVSLTVSNGVESFSESKEIMVATNLVSAFSWKPVFEDDDYQAPLTFNFSNESISATHYNWSFPGGNPSSSSEANPSVIFNNPGTYLVSLTAINDKTTQTTTHSITVLPDTNLCILSNVQLGINSAHNNNLVGAFYAIGTKQVYKANQINNNNSGTIEIAYLGLNSTFGYNKFISPSEVQNYGFSKLTNAQQTIVINSQQLCGCGLNFTNDQFDAMTNDIPLKSMTIENTSGGSQEFGNALPRIVLFKTQDGRKGAIRMKQMVQNGTASYIVCDIKVQKHQ